MAFGISDGCSHSYGCSLFWLRSSIVLPTFSKSSRNLQWKQDDGMLEFNKRKKKEFSNNNKG